MSFSLSAPKNVVTHRQLSGIMPNADIAQILSYVSTQQTKDGLLGGVSGGRIDREIRRSKILFLDRKSTRLNSSHRT